MMRLCCGRRFVCGFLTDESTGLHHFCAVNEVRYRYLRRREGRQSLSWVRAKTAHAALDELSRHGRSSCICTEPAVASLTELETPGYVRRGLYRYSEVRYGGCLCGSLLIS